MTALRSSSQNSGTGATITVAEPAGAQVGDKVIVHLVMNGVQTPSDNNGGTPFTQKASANAPGEGLTIAIWERYKQSGDPSSYSFSISSDRWSAVATAWSDPHPSNVWEVNPSFTVDDTLSSTPISAPDITTLSANAIHVAAGAVDGSGTSITGTPATYTVIQTVSGIAGTESQSVTYKVIASPGSTGAQSFTKGTTDADIGVSYALVDYQPITVDTVTPDTFEDGETGIDIAGSDFGASQGDGRVVISPVDNIAGEPSETPATVVSSTLPNQANPTTSFTLTVPACQVDDILEVTFISRDHTSGTAHPTVSDDQSGGPSWTQTGFSSERQAHVFWRRATSGVAGSTITVSGCVGSSCGGLRVIRGALASGDPYADFVWEENASGNETHAGFTPTHDNSLVNFMVANDTNDTLTVTNMAAATLGTFEPEDYTDLSTGGNDCAIYVSGRGQSGTATGTGNFTWSQTNATTISGTWAIRPKVPAGAAVEQTVTSWSDTAIEFTAVQDTLTAGVDLYLFVETDGGASNPSGVAVQFTEGGGVVELVVADSAHGHAVDSPSLTQANTLDLGGSFHGLVSAEVALTQANVLVAGDSAHGQASDSPVLSQSISLGVVGSSHGHIAGGIDLTQANTLALAGAAHTHFADAIGLTQAISIAVAECVHGLMVDGVALVQGHMLQVGDSAHLHISEGLELTQANILAIGSAVHAHTADSADMSTADFLSVDSSAHEQTAEGTELVQASILTIGDSVHSLVSAEILLSQSTILAVGEAVHAMVSDGVTLSHSAVLAVASAVHLHAANEIDLTQAATIVVSDSVHALVSQQINLLMPGGLGVPPGRTIVVQAQQRVIVIQPESRIYRVH
jgi:hypothetical protein